LPSKEKDQNGEHKNLHEKKARKSQVSVNAVSRRGGDIASRQSQAGLKRRYTEGGRAPWGKSNFVSKRRASIRGKRG